MSTKRTQNSSDNGASIPAGMYVQHEDGTLTPIVDETPQIEASQSDAQESDVSDVGFDYDAWLDSASDMTTVQAQTANLIALDMARLMEYRLYESKHEIAYALNGNLHETLAGGFFAYAHALNVRIQDTNEALTPDKRKPLISQDIRQYLIIRQVVRLHDARLTMPELPAHESLEAYRISTVALNTVTGAFFRLPSRMMQTHDFVVLADAHKRNGGNFGTVYAMSQNNGLLVNASSHQGGKGYVPEFVKVSAIAARKAYALNASPTSTVAWGKRAIMGLYEPTSSDETDNAF